MGKMDFSLMRFFVIYLLNSQENKELGALPGWIWFSTGSPALLVLLEVMEK